MNMPVLFITCSVQPLPQLDFGQRVTRNSTTASQKHILGDGVNAVSILADHSAQRGLPQFPPLSCSDCILVLKPEPVTVPYPAEGDAHDAGQSGPYLCSRQLLLC